MQLKTLQKERERERERERKKGGREEGGRIKEKERKKERNSCLIFLFCCYDNQLYQY